MCEDPPPSTGGQAVLLIAALVVLVLYRQVTGRFVRSGDVPWRLPLALIAVGLFTLSQSHVDLTTVVVAITAADLLITAGLGAARGYAVRLETRDGWLYQRGGVLMLVLWLVTIGVRVGIGFAGAAIGAGTLLTASMTLSIGLSLLVQAAVLTRRVAADGRPVRPAVERRSRRERATL